MITRLKNPFKFGDPVEGDYYLPRPELAAAVSRFLENRIHVVLIGPRRFGKTSFVLSLIREFEAEDHPCLFIDIFNITSHRDFLQQLLRALKTKKNWASITRDFLLKIRPKVSVEVDPQTGHSSLGILLNHASDRNIKELIQDALSQLEKLGPETLVVIDEFQKITELDDQGWLEGTLRTYMQQLKNVSFLFTGSRKSIIYDMLNNHSRPFYRSCQSIDFPSFGEEFTDWILKRFQKQGIQCDPEAIRQLQHAVQYTPNYVQMVCFHLVAEGHEQISHNEITSTLRTVVGQNAYAYQTLLNTLTLNQQRVLRLAAIEEKQIFSQELLAKYEIPSTPALASSIKSLKEKGILDEEGTGRGKVIFDDPLFAIWLKMSYHAFEG